MSRRARPDASEVIDACDKSRSAAMPEREGLGSIRTDASAGLMRAPIAQSPRAEEAVCGCQSASGDQSAWAQRDR